MFTPPQIITIHSAIDSSWKSDIYQEKNDQTIHQQFIQELLRRKLRWNMGAKLGSKIEEKNTHTANSLDELRELVADKTPSLLVIGRWNWNTLFPDPGYDNSRLVKAVRDSTGAIMMITSSLPPEHRKSENGIIYHNNPVFAVQRALDILLNISSHIKR